jgi:hypothetical protein
MVVIARGIDHEKGLEVGVDQPQGAAVDLRFRAYHETMRWLAHDTPELKCNFRRRKVLAVKVP